MNWLRLAGVGAAVAVVGGAAMAMRASRTAEPPVEAGAPSPIPPFQHVILVVLENENASRSRGLPFMTKLATEGALLTDYRAVGHPSQPNYIALTSGSAQEVPGDSLVTLDRTHLGDLMEKRGLTWKCYAEGYPGGCFLGAREGAYVRKHVPFLSYANVQRTHRCGFVVNASELDADIQAGTLPSFALYVPDMNDDGHDTSVEFADKWLEGAFGPRLKDPAFTKGMLLIVVFDESRQFGSDRVFCALWGEAVEPGSLSPRRSNHYDLLRTIEEGFGTGTLGRGDERARAITGIWKTAGP